MMSLGLCSTSYIVIFDQNWHHLYSTSSGGNNLSSDIPRYWYSTHSSVIGVMPLMTALPNTWLVFSHISSPHNSSLPISLTDDIREYFGDTIAMYFGFLGFYSLSLVPPVLLVVVFAFSGAHEQTKNTVFAILNLVWGTVFLEAWKRRCSEISFKWGTLKAGIGMLVL